MEDIDIIKNHLRGARTLQGVGGVKLWNIKGVTYPKEMLASEQKKLPQRRDTPPKGWITAKEAAAILGTKTPSAARAYLQNHKVRRVIVPQKGGPPRNFYNPKTVQKLAAQRPPKAQAPEGWVDSVTARKLIKVGRSTLYRYVARGSLTEMKVRHEGYPRLNEKCFYPLEEVTALAERRKKYAAFMQQAEEYAIHKPDKKPC